MSKYKITTQMMHPQLRSKGRVMRWLLPYYKTDTFVFCNRFLQWFRRIRLPMCRKICIDRKDGTKLRLCVYRSKSDKKLLPALLWIHGGGYAIGVPETDDVFVREFMYAADCVVVSPDYRLSEEAAYPAAINDCYLALVWMIRNAERIGIDTRHIIVGGDSAGGGLTAALCILARDRGEVSVSFQMPLYPMLDDRPTESSKDNDAPVWNSKSNENAWKLYLNGLYKKDDVPVYAAPARLKDFNGLPPAFTFVGSIDPFRDETLEYIEKLKAAGVPAECVVFSGCFHGFDMLCPLANPSKQARALMRESFKTAIERYSVEQPIQTH